MDSASKDGFLFDQLHFRTKMSEAEIRRTAHILPRKRHSRSPSRPR